MKEPENPVLAAGGLYIYVFYQLFLAPLYWYAFAITPVCPCGRFPISLIRPLHDWHGCFPFIDQVRFVLYVQSWGLSVPNTTFWSGNTDSGTCIAAVIWRIRKPISK